MFYFLGIVADEDVIRGDFSPSYIVCKSHGTSENRSGYRVVRQDKTNKLLRNMNKVLVKSLIENDDLIEFMCNYRTRDHMHKDLKYDHEQTKKYYPKGLLCWFGCNEYGEPNNTLIIIKKIPDNKNRSTDDGLRMLILESKKIPKLNQVLSDEPTYETNIYSTVKPKLVQVGR